jgi:hypothetical protein
LRETGGDWLSGILGARGGWLAGVFDTQALLSDIVAPLRESYAIRIASGGVVFFETKNARWDVASRFAEDLALFVCPGGQSYAKSGTTGDGYPWLAALGLPIVAPAPALVPLTSPAAWARALSGIALPDVEVRLLDGAGKVAVRRARPVLFTHRGVSGPGAMDVSEPVARTPEAEWTLALDLLPTATQEALRERFLARNDATSLANVLTRGLGTPIPRRVAEAVLASVSAEAGATEPPWKLPRTARHALVEALKGLRVPIDGTLGYDAAEVTAGGLPLSAVDPGSMRVRDAPGLHVFGELLDLTGPIGGFHFQSAFACAEVAASAAGRDVAASSPAATPRASSSSQRSVSVWVRARADSSSALSSAIATPDSLLYVAGSASRASTRRASVSHASIASSNPSSSRRSFWLSFFGPASAGFARTVFAGLRWSRASTAFRSRAASALRRSSTRSR